MNLFEPLENRAIGLARLGRPLLPTFRYWMETEVHVYGFSIAANVLLSFFPFMIVMVSLCRYVFEWPAAERAIYLALSDYFPGQIGDFIQNNLRATVQRRGPFQIASVLLLLFTANGIFEPLEVALNRAWGVSVNRTFVKNQVISLMLIFISGLLVLLPVSFTAMQSASLARAGAAAQVTGGLTIFFYKLAAVPVTMFALFLVYWILPNRPIPPQRVAPVAIVVGLALEILKLLTTLTWPWLRLKLTGEYGPFVYSVTIVLWSFLAAMIVLAGAEWSARDRIQPLPDERV